MTYATQLFEVYHTFEKKLEVNSFVNCKKWNRITEHSGKKQTISSLKFYRNEHLQIAHVQVVSDKRMIALPFIILIILYL